MQDFYKKRIKYLIKFDSSKTINEQTGPGFTTQTEPGVPSISQTVEDSKNKYPNYCRYKQYAIFPTKNKQGASGEDTLIDGYCFYKSGIRNSREGGIGGIFIPKNAEIKFITSRTIDNASKVFSEIYGESERDLKIQLEKILPIGSVNKFYDDDGEEYRARVYQPEGYDDWVFKGFYKSDGVTPYVPPEWVDPRGKYGKFIDEWGQLMQWSIIIASAIASPFTGGGSLAIILEFAVEMGIGLAVGVRDFQKGDNIGAVFSLIQGILPLLKNYKVLTGISRKELKELEEEIIKSGLNESSSQRDLISFYNNLQNSKPEVLKTLTKIFDQDPYTKLKLSKGLTETLGEEAKKQIMKEMRIMFEQTPSMFKKLKLSEKLWARELGLNGIFLILEIALEVVLGRKFNNSEKEKLSKIFAKIPESHRLEFAESFASGIENFDETINSVETNNFLFKGKVDTEALDEYIKYVKGQSQK